MKFILILSIIFFSLLSQAATTSVACKIFINTNLVSEQTIKVDQKTVIVDDLGQYLIEIQSRDNRHFSLNCLDRYSEVRSYAEGTLVKSEDLLTLAIWKRTGLVEIQCVLRP